MFIVAIAVILAVALLHWLLMRRCRVAEWPLGADDD
jgi:hypothetical protein